MGWFLIVAVVLAGESPGSVTSDSVPRPNLLVLLADDLRADVLGPYGGVVVRTPNLDRLAKDGVVFRRAYVMGGMHGAICVPSRAMLLTGRALFGLDESMHGLETWPAALRSAGYTTHATGKWHNGPKALAEVFPEARAVMLGGMVVTQFEVPLVDLGPGGRLVNERLEGRHTSEVFADEAIRFLDAQAGREEPWALYVAFTAPHDPREAPEAFRQSYPPERMPLPVNVLPQHPFDNGELRVRDELLERKPRSREALRRHWADYAAVISHLDAQVGRILDRLERIGQASRTLVVFAGDNGLALGSHGLMGKQNLYEHSVRVPLIVRGPGVAAGGKSDALCYLMDLAPTVWEWGGMNPPAGLAGQSLVPVLGDPSRPHRSGLLFAYRDLMRAVSDGRWKLIVYGPSGRWQLFDLASDPDEQRDLADDPSQAERVTALRALMRRLQVELGDDPWS
ncbi:MAG: choline-sulfatase [Isosphaeraceae bacterium]|jgi:arylsulfatase A-like enzyme|nr:MAG: choline-sulfatase [Isosphaeraceae bacterium]